MLKIFSRMFSSKETDESAESMQSRNENSFCNFTIVPFYLNHLQDVTETSGTGIVAQGMITGCDDHLFMVWQSENPSLVIHTSLENAKSIHGHNGATEFVLGDPSFKNLDRDLMPLPFVMIHTEDPYRLSRKGLVGKGILCSNGFTIFRWCVKPYSVECFTTFDHFSKIHLEGAPYAKTVTLDETCSFSEEGILLKS